MKRKAISVALVALAGAANAAELVKYYNEEGQLVIANTIPSHLVYKGYTRISPDGKTIEVVPSLEEMQRLERESEQRAAQEAAREARLREDEALMKMYASPRDVEKARDRKLAEIDRHIGRLRGQIDRDTAQKRRLEAEAARRERAGRPVADIIDSLDTVAARTVDAEREIEMRRQEKARVREEFDRDLERIKHLYDVEETSQVASSSGE